MEDNYLIHHGVKGMKWGVRRKPKQLALPAGNSGSKKPLGSKDNPINTTAETITPKTKTKTKRSGPSSKTLNTANQLTKIGTQTVGQAKQVHDSYLSSKKAKNALEEAQQMSDKELRDRVNRLNLERQYSQMSPATVSKGQQAVSTALNAAQIAGGLAVTGLTIATLIQQLRGK